MDAEFEAAVGLEQSEGMPRGRKIRNDARCRDHVPLEQTGCRAVDPFRKTAIVGCEAETFHGRQCEASVLSTDIYRYFSASTHTAYTFQATKKASHLERLLT